MKTDHLPPCHPTLITSLYPILNLNVTVSNLDNKISID